MKKGGNVLDNFLEAMHEIPTKLSNVSTETLNKYGNQPIQSMLVLKSPLKPHWTGSLNLFSFGKFNEIAKKNDLEVLYHLSIIAYVDNTPIIYEKNEAVKIAPIDANQKLNEKGVLTIPVILNKELTLNQFVENTIKFMGEDKFYDYDALGVDGVSNNCQDFVTSSLYANGILKENVMDFAKQATQTITNDIRNDGTVSYLPKLAKFVTNMGSRFTRLIGRGKISKNDKLFYNYIKYMDKKGWEFL